MDCLIGICSTLVGEIAKFTVAPIGHQLGYIFHYERNIGDLVKQIENLNDKKTSIGHQVEQADREGKEAEDNVKRWQNEVEKCCQEAKEFLDDEGHLKAKCSCSRSLLSRHQLSRKSKKMAEAIACKIKEADNFHNIFYRRPLKISFENRDFEEFDTRRTTFRDIMEALEDRNCSRIGVYGIGGVGKTTLVTEVAHKAQKKDSFSKVVMVTVSQSYEITKIQKEIVEQLNLELKEESTSVVATRLRERLEGPNKILLILDDIWETLNLKKIIGINSKEDQRGCKILFVSRSRVVLDDGIDKNIEVKVLSKVEAMNLFKKYVGSKSEERNFNELATKIVGHCGGLPIAIVTIACTLRKKDDIRAWRTTLKKIKSSPRDGFGEAYLSVKISYDALESAEEKMILLLCSLHEEDANINVDNLMSIYAAWYELLFLNVGSLEQARDEVYNSVDNLKGYCLLLNGDKDGTVKMHDVIRQIVSSIAREDKAMYFFESSTSLKNNLNLKKIDDSTAISLGGHDFGQLPDNLSCPKLKLLMLEHEDGFFYSQDIRVPEGLLEEAKALRALCLHSVIVKPVSLSPHSLQNLQTLSLRNCVLEDIAFIGELKNLVILNLSHSKFKRLPEQIGKLICLRQLNLNSCTDLEVIWPNVISNLEKLEELYMGLVDIKWGMEADDGGGWNANLAELMKLPQLTALHLYVSDASALPKVKLFDSEKLKRFNIVVGEELYNSTSSRLLKLKLKEQRQLYECGFLNLMKEAEELYLSTLPGVNNIVYQLDAGGFPQLKKLNINAIDEVQYIVESTGKIQPCSVFKNLERLSLQSLPNLEMICSGRFTPDSFGQLKSICVRRCHKLENVSSYRVIRKLEEITVENCSMMKEIVYRESEDQAADCDDEIEFSCLRSLTLGSLPNLIQLFSSKLEAANFHASSPITPSVPLFSEKVVFPSLEVLTLTDMDFTELWPNGLSSTSFMQNLTRLIVKRCKNLKYLIVGSLMQLEHLEVSDCSAMEEVIKEGSTQSSRKILFPKLTSLEIESLQSLKRFCGGDYDVFPQLESFTSTAIEQTLFSEKFVFPSLEVLMLRGMDFSELWPNGLSSTSFIQNLTRLTVESCKNLKYLFPFAIVESLTQLEHLEVSDCSAMEEVINEGSTPSSRKILFPKLTYLKLESLQSLKRFCGGDYDVECESLLEIYIYDCPQLESFTSTAIKQTLFSEKYVFPSLVVLMLRGVDFSELWPNGLSSTSFIQNLTSLTIESCKNLKYLFPFAIVESLTQLEQLEVSDCSAMEEVIKEGSTQSSRKILFPKLTYLVLKSLQSLKRFGGGDCEVECESLLEISIFECPQLESFTSMKIAQTLLNEKVISFPRLESLSMFESCENLKYLLSYEMTSQLESLKVVSCLNMEEVVVVKEADEGGSLNDISFPKLKHLELSGLEKFKRFSSADCVQCFPSLLELTINNEPQTNVGFGSKVAAFNVFSKMIFENLQELDIWGQNSLPFAAIKSLQQLKKLEVSFCDVMEHVISKARGEEDRTLKKIFFPKLESIMLGNLPKLETFCEGSDYILDCPSLLRIDISDCGKLRTFIPNSTRMLREDGQEVEVRESVIQEPLFNEKVTSFPRLESLSMFESCESLKHLLSYKMASQLESLEVDLDLCLDMEEVVVIKEADEGGSLNNISFPKLKHLKLSHLGKFKRFSSADCVQYFPSLLNLEIDNRRGSAMAFFFGGKVVFSKLEELTIRGLGEDVNAIWTDQSSTFQSIQTLLVESCPGLKTLVMSSYLSFRNLTDVVISELDGIISLFDSSTAKSLEQLTRMGISECNQMTQVIRMNEEEEAESDEIIFRRLKILALHHLPSLESFYSGNNMLEFPNLEKLIVSECPEMRSFSHGAINSPNLNRIISMINYWPTWADATKRWFEKLERAKPEEELVLEGNLNSSIRKLWEDLGGPE